MQFLLMSSWFSWYQFIKMYFFNKYNIEILYLDSWYNCTSTISEIPRNTRRRFFTEYDDYFYKSRPFFRWFFLHIMIIFDSFFYRWLILLDFFINEFFSQIVTCDFFTDNLFDRFFYRYFFTDAFFYWRIFLQNEFFYRWDMGC